MSEVERILEVIDQGLQHSGETDYHPDLSDGTCWRCNKEAPAGPIGLCAECDEWLHADLTVPPSDSARLLAPGTLPEEISEGPPPFGDAIFDYTWRVIDDEPGPFGDGVPRSDAVMAMWMSDLARRNLSPAERIEMVDYGDMARRGFPDLCFPVVTDAFVASFPAMSPTFEIVRYRYDRLTRQYRLVPAS